MKGKLQIFATRSMKDYAERVVHILGMYPTFSDESRNNRLFGELSVLHFADGEMEVEVPHSIRGNFVVLFANSARNPENLTVEANKMEIYHAIDALKRSQPGRLLILEPYCSPSRSDRTTRRNSVGIWVHLKILMSLGTDHIITYQLHSDKTKTIIDPSLCAVDDIPMLILLKKYLFDTFIKSREVLEHEVRSTWCFCSVDAGGEGFAKKFARAFGAELLISHKQRDYKRPNTIQRIDILSSDSIEGKIIWIVDDMIDTGGSVCALVEELSRRSVAQINIIVVHPVFSAPAVERLRELHDRRILNHLIVTDTVPCTPAIREALPFIHVISTAETSAEIIMSIYNDTPLSRFFQSFDVQEYLSSPQLFI